MPEESIVVIVCFQRFAVLNGLLIEETVVIRPLWLLSTQSGYQVSTDRTNNTKHSSDGDQNRGSNNGC